MEVGRSSSCTKHKCFTVNVVCNVMICGGGGLTYLTRKN